MATLLSSIETQARRHLKELPALSAPSAPTVTPQGTTGATSYAYRVVAGHRQGTTEASSAGSTATGNASLSTTNFNRVTWTDPSNAEFIVVYRVTGGGSTGVVGVVAAGVQQFDDTGLTGDATSFPTVNTAGGRFWSSQELLDIMVKGAQDLWKAIIDLHQEHFETDNITDVSLAADALSLTGVPTDTFRVLMIEPRDTTPSSAFRNVIFRPAAFNSPQFQNARAMGTRDPQTGLVILYAIRGAGSPVAAPTIVTAPAVSTTIPLRFTYVPTLGTLTAGSSNPIPGDMDMALIAWTVAYARAKERPDRSPDPNWLTVYGTEKANGLTALTPRQSQEDTVVGDFFQPWW